MRKLRERKGGAIILISMVTVIIAIGVILPAIVNTSTTHLVSKKIKIHLNSAAKSGAITLVDWNEETQVYDYLPDESIAAMNTTVNKSFNADGQNNFSVIDFSEEADYKSVTYKNFDGKIAFQVFVFENTAVGSRPSVAEISTAISRDSEGNEIPGWQNLITRGQTTIGYSTAIIVMRYDYIHPGTAEIQSMIRISAAQNKNI